MVTRKDIAQKANVSISVVSRALNNSGYVEAEKKKRILEIAEELNYHPNPVAMSLMERRTKQIMFYCKDLKNAFNIEVYEGMLEEAKKYGYMVVIHGNLDFESVKNMMVDGLILTNEEVTARYLENVGSRYYLPVVTASYGSPISFKKSVPMIECDLFEGCTMLLQYLWDKNHRKIAMISPYEFKTSNSRTCAWREFMKYELTDHLKEYYFGIDRKSLENDERIYRFPEEAEGADPSTTSENYFEKGMLAAELFAEQKCDATAVVAFNDEMALGFYKKMRLLGYQIPENVSVVGFDGIYARRYTDQLLTTLSLSPRLQGAKCVEVLMNILIEKKYKYITRIPLKILEGETVRDLRR
ncbi:MAG: LacI family DNA-binding transcriptional regulator [Marvinbryantia sp.]|jgi:LacI family repressor for deo operon, udp, cdd, tsx, nupC, and nupG